MELDINWAKILFTLPIDLPVLGQLKISETMIVSWIVMLLITGLCIWLTHDLKEENISKMTARHTDRCGDLRKNIKWCHNRNRLCKSL